MLLKMIDVKRLLVSPIVSFVQGNTMVIYLTCYFKHLVKMLIFLRIIEFIFKRLYHNFFGYTHQEYVSLIQQMICLTFETFLEEFYPAFLIYLTIFLSYVYHSYIFYYTIVIYICQCGITAPCPILRLKSVGFPVIVTK